MKLQLLLTDYLVLLLLFSSIGFACYARRHEHLRAPWRQVFASHIGAATGTVLLVFVAIGMLDSIHYIPGASSPSQSDQPDQAAQPAQPAQHSKLLSVFDTLVTPMRTQVEKTYSAPFATHSFVKEMQLRADGSQVRDYPALQYAGAHLAAGQSKSRDIASKALSGAAAGLALWLLLVVLLTLSAGRAGWRTRTLQLLCRHSSRRTALLTALGILLLGGASYHLSAYYHVWGTDKVGYDVFYITLKSVRTGLVIGTLTTLVMLPFALLLGLSAGYFKGWVDDIVQYIYTTLNAIPGVLLIAAAVLMLDVYMYNNAEQFTSVIQRADWRLFFICLILGTMSWTGLCRLLRAETMKLREMDYVTAATAFGVRHHSILLRHILPNVMHLVLISVVLDFSGLVLAEAVLSYVGIGVDPSTHSWGNMINSARLEMAREPMVWWSLCAAFVAMFALVLCANLFTDVVRDAFDPRLRERQG